jgi:hypothetical protein
MGRNIHENKALAISYRVLRYLARKLFLERQAWDSGRLSKHTLLKQGFEATKGSFIASEGDAEQFCD